MMLREDFCLITGFHFGKVEIDPKEEDHSEFRKRVFPGVPNLKGEHLLKLINKYVKFNKLDDKDEENSSFNKLTPSAIEMNELWWRSSLDYFKKVTPSITVIRSATKGIINSKSVHTRVRAEVRHKVRVRTEVSRVADKEEVHVRAVNKEDVRTQAMDEEDIRERAELLKTIKEQEQVIIDLQRRLLSVEEITKQLKPGPSNIDHLDQTGNRFENVPVCGLDQQFMEGVSHCMNVNVDEPYKNWNDVSGNFPVNGLDHQSVEEVSQCTILNDEYESVDVDCHISLRSQDVGHISKFLSTQQVRELMNDVFYTPSLGPNSVKDDACVSELMDTDQPSLVKNVLYDVHIDSVVKDAKESENPSQKFPGKVYLFPYIQLPSTEVKCRKKRCREVLPWKEDLTCSPTAPKRIVSVPEVVMALFRDKSRIEMHWNFPWVDDSHLVQIDFWEKLVGRSHTKRGCLSSDHLDIWIEYLWQFRDPNADWAITSPYLSDMLSRFEYPLYYTDGVKYGVPWFANNVQKIPLYLDNAEVFEKKNIDKEKYLITFQYTDGVPLQGGLYGCCGIWVCVFLYRLSHNIPLEVDDPISFALSYRERMIEFYWKYKMLQ
uniref:Ulp1 protease family, C-terminal catalytic domain-containing protein n=1 Tax=Tanacetum cinerariifolium TaxID=118510 RepID=A0A6L2KSF1_TANCI|nr:ulp1 protease family, C-terminal catalytic domain-containing protein [Tanacetum cinerariifolium]